MKAVHFLLACIILFRFEAASGQKDFINNSTVTGITYAGKNVKMLYIPPPAGFLAKGSKGGGNITVSYSNFPDDARAAFEYAVTILESVLPAGTDMTVAASWEKITTENVLGNSVITGFAAGWSIDALDPLAYYPVSLAEKISGKKLNDDLQGDFQLKINSSISWYRGTDGRTPPSNYDLVTVVLHELCHGLGFFDSMNVNATVGYYGLGGLPVVFDNFVENLPGQKLTDTLAFESNTAELYNQLISGQLYFNGPLVRQYHSGSRARLYAPSSWDNGSSVSHLDEVSNPDNPLMTPFIDPGEAIHNPGRLTLMMLGDMGWINTRIIHTPSGDTEEALHEVPLSIEIKSDTTFNRDRVGVVFSFDDFESDDTLFMTTSGPGNIFRTTLDILSYNTDLQYYFFVEDAYHRIFKSPSLNELIRYSSYIGTDTIDPIMIHSPVKFCLQTADTVEFNAVAFDNTGIDSVYMEYRINSGSPRYSGFRPGKDDTFRASLRIRELNTRGGDTIYYRIFAVDSARVANISVLPEKSYYTFPVEKIFAAVDRYSTDFIDAAPDFFNLGFSILQPAGFNRPGLHTRHPYESPEVENGKIEYTAMLRYPIILDESGLLISYDEIVLVEPGEAGSVYGSPDFFDYVIVEASDDFGKTWVPLDDGYDSRYSKSWEEAYNTYISGNNSNYFGSESMLAKHTIYYKPADKLTPGDEVLIRFRLFSDPFAYGWGWAIQDLSVNALINSVSTKEVEHYTPYPNPGNGHIRIKGLQPGKPFRFSVYNSTGTGLIKEKLSDGSGSIDISSFPSGLYIINLYIDNELRTFRYSLIRR